MIDHPQGKILFVLGRTEMSDQIPELGEILGFEPISLLIRKGRLRWFGHEAHQDDWHCYNKRSL